jgi:hypothetical protein
VQHYGTGAPTSWRVVKLNVMLPQYHLIFFHPNSNSGVVEAKRNYSLRSVGSL